MPGNTESILYDVNGDPLAIDDGIAIPAGTPLIMSGGSDGTNARYVKVDSSGNQVIIGLGTAGTPAGGVITIQGSASGTAVPISGTVTANAGSGNFAVVQATAALLNATVTGTVIANIGTTGGLALDATLAKLTITPGTAIGSNTLAMVGGHVTTASPTYTNGNINPFSLTTAGALRIDGSGITQPVSGTVTANQGTANTLANRWPVIVTDGTNTMPTADVAARAQFEKITDGTNTAAVKAASTAAVAADPSLVVAISPNTPISTTSLLTADLSSSFSPDPGAEIIGVANLMVDASSNLQVRGQVLTDEGSLRDDFIGASLTTALTGTVTFTNNSTAITGSGTSFTTEVTTNSYIKKTADSETLYVRVSSVDSDTALTLESNYTGTSSSTTAVESDWKTSITGGSITVTGSEVLLASSTANANIAQISRQGDYLPFTLNTRARITQRIANQTAIIGFQDTPGSAQQQAVIVFDGTSNTVVKFRTSASSAAADIQETQINLPTGLNTSQTLIYEIDLENDSAILLINGSVVATHTFHLPQPYTALQIVANIINSAVVTTTTLALDLIFFSNTDIVQIGNTFAGDPIKVTAVSSASRTGLAFGQANTGGSAGTLTALRATTYTEQTTNAQRSIKSSSATDSSAGIGARQVKITYYDQTMAGPFVETMTTNGTTTVATTNTNICFIEKMEVVSVGSNRTNTGTITLFVNSAGGGGTIGTIALSNVVTAGTVGDNQTLWAHHYVQTGKTCSVTTVSGGTNGNQSGVTFLRSVDPTVTTNVELQLTESFVTVAAAGSGSIFRVAGIPIQVSGPARITLYSVSNGTNTSFYGGFEYSE